MGIRGETGWQSGGNLDNGRNAGPSYVNGNNGLGNRNWNIWSRLSGLAISKHHRHVYPARARA